MFRNIYKIIWMLVLAGVFLALMRAHDYNPFAVIEWMWSWIVHVVSGIADWLMGSEWFKEAAKAPAP